jgi:hypothetical protein
LGLRTALAHAEEWKLISAVPRVRWLKVAQAKFAFSTSSKRLGFSPPGRESRSERCSWSRFGPVCVSANYSR